MGKGLLCHDAGIVYQELRGEIVCPVKYEIVVFDKIENILACNECVVGIYRNIGIYSFHCFLCGLNFRLSDIGGGVYDLSLEIGKIDLVRVSYAYRAYSGSGEIQSGGRSESAGADYEDFRVCKLFLSLRADFL